jgi:hypothetical protein
MATSPALLNWYNTNNQATKLNSRTAVNAPTGMIKQVKNWQITPDQTVAQQVNGLVKADSPLMQQARTAGDQEAQSRGLLNSSIGIKAAQDSVYSAALPIAQADAATAARAAGYNVDTWNQANATNNQNQFNRLERLGQQKFTTGERLGQQKFTTGERLGEQQHDMTKEIYSQGQQNTRQNRELFAGLSNDFTKQMTQINQDPNMTQQAKDWAIKQIYDSYKSNLNIVTQAGKVPNVSNLLKNWKPAKKPKSSYRNFVTPPSSGGGGGGGSIICTRLYELGYMDSTTYAADSIYGCLTQAFEPDFYHWYLDFAKPIVANMHGKTVASRVFIQVIRVFAEPWAKQMAFEIGVGKQASTLGKVVMVVGKLAYALSRNLPVAQCYANN